MWRYLALVCALLIPAQSFAAIAEVGSGSQRATGTIDNVDSGTVAFPGNVTSGSLLSVAGACFHTGGGTVAITDTRSTSYTILQGVHGTDHILFIAYGFASSGGANTVTVDPTTTGNYCSFGIDEFSGVHATPLDVDGSTSTGTGTAVADSLTTGTANALIIGVMGFSDPLVSTTITPGGSYTQIGEQEDNNNHEAHNSVFRLATTATSYSVDWTLSASRSWFARTAAFKEAAAAGGTAARMSLLGVGQ